MEIIDRSLPRQSVGLTELSVILPPGKNGSIEINQGNNNNSNNKVNNITASNIKKSLNSSC